MMRSDSCMDDGGPNDETVNLIPSGAGAGGPQRRTAGSIITTPVVSPSSGGGPLHDQATPGGSSGLGGLDQAVQPPPGSGGLGGARGSHPRQAKPGTNSVAFNPRLIFSQIVALQSFHYLTLGFCIQCNHVVYGSSITIDRIFTSQYFDIWTGEGWVDNAAVLISALVGSVLLAAIVEKSKKCLDFSVTLFFIHFIACCLYGGAPNTYSWWIVHIMATILMTLLGEYLCSIREMNEIPLLPYGG
mmetsp:Transcript_13015/g.37118  ORF Transcript_13015/g.37118 Transcript_13015/m.37118 type:complete len:244 (-) Transcript_13015:696-1427(-)|eukprot:CAMPEP_0181041930 /NCGR_PEP_ID=MMETSP1070-20121207/11870_1 /TAXON_ID=265543 /ORGANISM="Minutocellus polymorphus, Strain NH13" /LENGTH=243 /DNA_ID=CAMNT_0023120091 /DNA_START=289 /DNA_END=1020 /DNA_ORIENTATION=-